MKLRDNQWGFDLDLDNPFLIFPVLRNIAIESVGEENVVDLSRGDPGFGFCPSGDGREFYAFLLELDIFFNNPDHLFVNDNRDDYATLRGKVEVVARSSYSEDKAIRVLKNFDIFVDRILSSVNKQGLDWDERQVFFEIFKYSTVSGGTYLMPPGEDCVRAVIAEHYNEHLRLGLDYSDIILVQGVSHGIGTVFEFFCDEGIGFLKKGDSVLIASPVYAPYNTIMQNRGLNTFSIPIDPETGKVIGDLDEILAGAPENLKMICLIDPNNPTGFMNDEEFLRKIAEFADERDALIISDEVYSDFFDERLVNVMKYARKRTIMIGGRSKIERATGLRFGEFVIAKEAKDYIWNNFLGGAAYNFKNLMQALTFAKAPAGIRGEFQHVTFVTAPSQFMGLAHMIFGEIDRAEYLRRIKLNMKNIYEILGMEYHGNLYYACFDLFGIPGNTKSEVDPHDVFVGLAKKGVVLIPSNLFFSEELRAQRNYKSFARASVPNVTPPNLEKAARLVKEYMTS